MKEPEHTAADGTVRKDHYGTGRQPWDDILDLGWGPEFAAGNTLKYVRRHAAKGGEDDLEKGRWYHKRLLSMAFGDADGRRWTPSERRHAREVLLDLQNVITQQEEKLLR